MKYGKTLLTLLLIFLTVSQGFSLSGSGCPQLEQEESQACEGHSCCKDKSRDTAMVHHQKKRVPSWKNSIFCVEVVTNIDTSFPPLMEEYNPCCEKETPANESNAALVRTTPSVRDSQLLFVEDLTPVVQTVYLVNIINEEHLSSYSIELVEITRLLC